eukprot:3388771-Prymnesium_polylepis.1
MAPAGSLSPPRGHSARIVEALGINRTQGARRPVVLERRSRPATRVFEGAGQPPSSKMLKKLVLPARREAGGAGKARPL